MRYNGQIYKDTHVVYIEFTTNAVPDVGGHPFQPTWSGNRTGVSTVDGKASISCTVTNSNCN